MDTYRPKVIIMLLIGLTGVLAGWWSDMKALNIDENNSWKTIESKTLSTHYVVEFFSENCGWCQKWKPDWDKMVDKFNSDTDIMISSINANKSPKLADKFGIHAFPTIVYFVPGKSMYKYKYEGQRTFENVKKWIEECRKREDGQSQIGSSKEDQKKFQEKLANFEETLENGKNIGKNDVLLLVKGLKQVVDDQQKYIERLTENLKKVKELAKDSRKNKSSNETNYFSHILTVLVITVCIVGVILFISSGKGDDTPEARRKIKKKVDDDDLPPSLDSTNGYDEEDLDGEARTRLRHQW
ncbi:unnamed protein product [Moneuplotes crassus]|uniref:Thioredoxin domain-containing protein n=1 Tax=Euplotes crassus TaxID=5936 RepID=A0AAD2D071_EUPCR|nr:unnamed protein product [Moneuplotes crassus]